ncbi:hypothetical protein BDZ85DRAFT_280480 [Elsinoe ampelina]|uniref:Uncharacterized protein n=1 Tax=Elsinoe ampelina TaxID=302913 RepID=A0A6A6GIJ9_9PEZI|nr:hypothetical protein BDZ85DRAFT_280480 [Elsinoe ampelina]
MAFLGIKTGYASALEGMIAGLGKKAGTGSNTPGLGSGGRLKSLEITGKGAHLWDLGELLRPTILGEWETIERWIDLIGRRIIPHLLGAVGASQPDNVLKRIDSATAMNEEGKTPTVCNKQRLSAELVPGSGRAPWTGMMWTKKRFSLVALDIVPNERGVKGMGYKNMMSWEEIMLMTTLRGTKPPSASGTKSKSQPSSSILFGGTAPREVREEEGQGRKGLGTVKNGAYYKPVGVKDGKKRWYGTDDALAGRLWEWTEKELEGWVGEREKQ